MGPAAAFRWARFVANEPLRRRGAVVGALALSERLLTPAAAWAVFQWGFAARIGLVAALSLAVAAYSFVSKAFAARTEADLTARVIECLLGGDVLRTSVLTSEDAHAELGQAVYTSALALSQILPTLVADLVASALLAAVVAAAEPARVVLGALALTLCAAVVLGWSQGRIQRAVLRTWDFQLRAFDALVDALEGRLEIVASGERASFVVRACEKTRLWAKASVHTAGAVVLSGRLPFVAIAALVALTFGAGPGLRGSLSVPLADLALLAAVVPAFAGVAHGVNGAMQAERWLRIVGQVVRNAGPAADRGRPLSERATDLAFEGVSFRYEGMRVGVDALKDVSFAARCGHLLAIAGANGSGKSTCLRLLLALARPAKGTIRINGVDLSDLDADAWRARVAFLPQRPYLPPRSTVGTAIRFLAPASSDETMRRALDRVGLAESLSRGGANPLDAGVDALSVGQRQRVALARMLCREASVFLLDEPEANLDRAGIDLVTGIVRELAKEHTVIVAVHTLELLALADDVVTLRVS
jgi:ABC-type multidrug transport system fused ATPase/permease subunit